MPDGGRLANASKVAVRLRSTGLGQHYAEDGPSPSFVPDYLQ
jgi:hypothetical protein